MMAKTRNGGKVRIEIAPPGIVILSGPNWKARRHLQELADRSRRE